MEEVESELKVSKWEGRTSGGRGKGREEVRQALRRAKSECESCECEETDESGMGMGRTV